jgi:hypothetical protein
MGSTVLCGRAAWPPEPRDDQLELVRRGQERAGARAHVAHIVERVHMQAEDRIDAGQRAFLHHAHPARLALVVLRLFAGLEEQTHRTGQPALVGQPLEHRRRAQQHGRVRVVAAGVHDARPRAVELGAVDLLDRQRVHVGAQADHRAVAPADVADDASLGDFGLGGNAQVDQRGVDQTGGALLGEGQFRVAVNLAAPAADLFVDRFGSVKNLCG